jgi:hypothetical protein
MSCGCTVFLGGSPCSDYKRKVFLHYMNDSINKARSKHVH